MTIERAMKVLQDLIDIYHMGFEDEDIKALDLAIKALEQQTQGWIPANKMLPRENTVVVGTTIYNDIYIVTLYNYHGVYKWYSNDNLECNLPIVAWIPLPENYGREEGD